ncbi:hypothetical protein NP493_113g04044 [Ridgeia piscesae]|uniref:Uncharacterized protein n=1 Tax=Ridgeia piscesae TaxID=27915 RepID=A0AAD9UH74_RIDPI|nr:hypothetical protein NP493_113g04044 [Ridgeia piscesae]
MCFPHGGYGRRVISTIDICSIGYTFLVCFRYVFPKTVCIFSLHGFSHGICSSHIFALLTLFKHIFKM